MGQALRRPSRSVEASNASPVPLSRWFVLDLGAHTMRAGCAAAGSVQVACPSLVAWQRGCDGVDASSTRWCYGNEAAAKAGKDDWLVSRVFHASAARMNWQAVRGMLREVLVNQLGAATESFAVAVIPPRTKAGVVLDVCKRTAQILLQDLQASAVVFADRSVGPIAQLVPSATGIVVDLGMYAATVVPVCDAQPLPLRKQIDVDAGGDAVTALLAERAQGLSGPAGLNHLMQVEQLKAQQLRCDFSSKPRRRSSAQVPMHANSSVSVRAGALRVASGRYVGLAGAVVDVVKNSDIELRRGLLANIVITGAAADALPGLGASVKREVAARLQRDPVPIPSKIKVLKRVRVVVAGATADWDALAWRIRTTSMLSRPTGFLTAEQAADPWNGDQLDAYLKRVLMIDDNGDAPGDHRDSATGDAAAANH